MKRYLILGDLHCRSIWKDIVAKEADLCDKIIFLGDYLPPRHDIKLDDPTDACGFLYDVLNYKDQNPDKVILLIGNHDLDLLGYSWAKCYPRAHPKVYQYCQTEDVKNWFLNNTQWIYNIPDTNIVCSHAGIGEIFFEDFKKYYGLHINSDENIVPGIVDINKVPPCELFAFNGGWWDTNGDSVTQPCTWIRPTSLVDCSVKNIIQVVGHTPVDHIFKTESNEGYCPEIWCCDCLENEEYLIIENGKFKPTKL